MTFSMNSRDYMQYVKLVCKKIADSKDYISEIDAATGDGDHWVNMNMGFEAIAASAEEFSEMRLSEMFKQIGKKFISVVGAVRPAFSMAARILRQPSCLRIWRCSTRRPCAPFSKVW